MVDFKLGKHPKREDSRTLKLASYLTPQLAPPPATADWTTKVSTWPMFNNDTVGDCTCAAAGHDIEAWTVTAQGQEAAVTDAEVIAAYAAITGYNPQTGANDNGANELDVLNYWRKTGIANHKIGAYAEVVPTNQQHVQQAVYLFGGLYLGLQLPTSAQAQVQNHEIWDVATGPDGEPGSWGGHAVPVMAYDQGSLTVVTWGTLQKMTWAFFDKYCDEAYAIISNDWLSNAGQAPVGLNLTQLTTDLGQIGSAVSSSSGGTSSSGGPSSSSSGGWGSSSSSG